ncbi:MAG: hypothetical protein RLP02_16675 [Coleofasciculus sp. C2-GNP5-27]
MYSATRWAMGNGQWAMGNSEEKRLPDKGLSDLMFFAFVLTRVRSAITG